MISNFINKYFDAKKKIIFNFVLQSKLKSMFLIYFNFKRNKWIIFHQDFLTEGTLVELIQFHY